MLRGWGLSQRPHCPGLPCPCFRGTCLCICGALIPRRPNWSSWISLGKEEGERKGQRAGGAPWVAAPTPAALPSRTVQAAGWLAWPFRVLILARMQVYTASRPMKDRE